MSRSHRRTTTLAVVIVLAWFGCVGCATPASSQAESGDEPSAAVTHGQPDGSDDESVLAEPETDTADEPDADGGADPAQETVRTGPIAQYGGPAWGDQGVIEVIAVDRWCKAIFVEFGNMTSPVPDGVRYTFERALADREGLAFEAAACGTHAPDRSCLGLTVHGNAPGLLCSLLLRPGTDFTDGTRVSLEGTLRCPTLQACEDVRARLVGNGPAIIVDRPADAGTTDGTQSTEDAETSEQDGSGSDDTDTGTGGTDSTGDTDPSGSGPSDDTGTSDDIETTDDADTTDELDPPTAP